MFKLCMFCCLLRFIFAQRYKYLTTYQFKCLSSDVTDIFHPNIKARIASGVFLNTRAQRAWLCRPLVLAVLDPQHPPLPGLWSPKRRGPLPTTSPRSLFTPISLPGLAYVTVAPGPGRGSAEGGHNLSWSSSRPAIGSKDPCLVRDWFRRALERWLGESDTSDGG